jgi:hypothetical protein
MTSRDTAMYLRMSPGEADELGTQLERAGHGHGRVHSVDTGGVGRRGDHAPAVLAAAHHDRLALQARVVADLDGSVERIHVDVGDHRRPGLRSRGRRRVAPAFERNHELISSAGRHSSASGPTAIDRSSSPFADPPGAAARRAARHGSRPRNRKRTFGLALSERRAILRSRCRGVIREEDVLTSDHADHAAFPPRLDRPRPLPAFWNVRAHLLAPALRNLRIGALRPRSRRGVRPGGGPGWGWHAPPLLDRGRCDQCRDESHRRDRHSRRGTRRGGVRLGARAHREPGRGPTYRPSATSIPGSSVWSCATAWGCSRCGKPWCGPRRRPRSNSTWRAVVSVRPRPRPSPSGTGRPGLPPTSRPCPASPQDGLADADTRAALPRDYVVDGLAVERRDRLRPGRLGLDAAIVGAQRPLGSEPAYRSGGNGLRLLTRPLPGRSVRIGGSGGNGGALSRPRGTPRPLHAERRFRPRLRRPDPVLGLRRGRSPSKPSTPRSTTTTKPLSNSGPAPPTTSPAVACGSISTPWAANVTTTRTSSTRTSTTPRARITVPSPAPWPGTCGSAPRASRWRRAWRGPSPRPGTGNAFDDFSAYNRSASLAEVRDDGLFWLGDDPVTPTDEGKLFDYYARSLVEEFGLRADLTRDLVVPAGLRAGFDLGLARWARLRAPASEPGRGQRRGRLCRAHPQLRLHRRRGRARRRARAPCTHARARLRSSPASA